MAGLAGICESRNAGRVAIPSKIIRELGGPKKVAAALDMTPSGVWRYTQPGAEVPPRRQRALVALARQLGVALDFPDFYRDEAPLAPIAAPKRARAQAPATPPRKPKRNAPIRRKRPQRGE